MIALIGGALSRAIELRRPELVRALYFDVVKTPSVSDSSEPGTLLASRDSDEKLRNLCHAPCTAIQMTEICTTTTALSVKPTPSRVPHASPSAYGPPQEDTTLGPRGLSE